MALWRVLSRSEDQRCSINKIFYVGRHCSRYPTKNTDIKDFVDLVKNLPRSGEIQAHVGWLSWHSVLCS